MDDQSRSPVPFLLIVSLSERTANPVHRILGNRDIVCDTPRTSPLKQLYYGCPHYTTESILDRWGYDTGLPCFLVLTDRKTHGGIAEDGWLTISDAAFCTMGGGRIFTAYYARAPAKSGGRIFAAYYVYFIFNLMPRFRCA